MDFSSWFETSGPQRNAYNKYKKAQEDAVNERKNFFTQPNMHEDLQPQGVFDGLFTDFDVDVDDIFSGSTDFYNTSDSDSTFMADDVSAYTWDFENTGKDEERGDYVTQSRVGNNKQIKGSARYELEQSLLGRKNTAWGFGGDIAKQIAKGKENTLYGWSNDEVDQSLSGYKNTAYGYAKDGTVNQRLDGLFNIFNKFFGKGKEVNQKLGDEDAQGHGNYARAHGETVEQSAFGNRNWLRGSGEDIRQTVNGNYNIFDAMGDDIFQNIESGYDNKAIAYGKNAEQNVSDEAFFSTLISYADYAKQTGSENIDNIFTMGGDIFGNGGDDFIKTLEGASEGSIDAGVGDDIVKIAKGKDKTSKWDVSLGEGSDVVKVDATGYKGELSIDGSDGNDKLVLEGAKFSASDIKVELDDDTGEHVITVGTGSKKRIYRTKDVEELQYVDKDGKVQTITIEEKEPERKIIEGRDSATNPDNLDLTGETTYKDVTVDLKAGDDKVKLDGTKDMSGLKVVGGAGDDTATVTNVDESKELKVTDKGSGKYEVQFTDKNGVVRTFETDSLENLAINDKEAKKLSDLAKPDDRKVIEGRDSTTNPDNLDLTGETTYKNVTVDLKAGDDKVKLDGTKDMSGLKVVGGAGDDTATVTNVDESKELKVTDKGSGKYEVQFTDKNGVVRTLETDSLENLAINDKEAKKLSDLAKPDDRKVIEGRDSTTNPDNLDLTGETTYKNVTVDLKAGDDKVKLDGTKDMSALKVVGGAGDDTATVTNVDESKELKVTDKGSGKYEVQFTDKNGVVRTFETDSLENLAINDKEAKKLSDLAKPDDRKEFIYDDNAQDIDHTAEKDLSNRTYKLGGGNDSLKFDGTAKTDGLHIDGGAGDNDTVVITKVKADTEPKVTKDASGLYTIEYVDEAGATHKFTAKDVENLSINGISKPIKDLLPPDKKEFVYDDNAQTIEISDKDLRNRTYKLAGGNDSLKFDGTAKTDGLHIDGGAGDSDTVAITKVKADTEPKVTKDASGLYTIEYVDEAGVTHKITAKDVENLSINGTSKPIKDFLPPDPKEFVYDDNAQTIETSDKDLRNRTYKLAGGNDSLKFDGTAKTDGLHIDGGAGDNDTVAITKVKADTEPKVTKDASGLYTIEYVDEAGATHKFTAKDVENLSINGTSKPIKDFLPPDPKEFVYDDNAQTVETSDKDLRNRTYKLAGGNDVFKFDGTAKTDGLHIDGGAGDNDTVAITKVKADTEPKVTKDASGLYTIEYVDEAGVTHKITAKDVENLSINGTSKPIKDFLPPDTQEFIFDDTAQSVDHSSQTDLRGRSYKLGGGDDSLKIKNTAKTDGLVVDGGAGTDILAVDGPVTLKSIVKTSNYTETAKEYEVSYEVDVNGTKEIRKVIVKDVESLDLNGTSKTVSDWIKSLETPEPDTVNFTEDNLKKNLTDIKEGTKFIGTAKDNTLGLEGFTGELKDLAVTAKGTNEFEVTVSGKKFITKDVEHLSLKDSDENTIVVDLKANPEFKVTIAEKAGSAEDIFKIKDIATLPDRTTITGNGDDIIKLENIDNARQVTVKQVAGEANAYEVTDPKTGKKFIVKGDVSIQGSKDTTPVKLASLIPVTDNGEVRGSVEKSLEEIAKIPNKTLTGDDDDRDADDKDILKIKDPGLALKDVKSVVQNADGSFTVTIKDQTFTVKKLEQIEIAGPDGTSITIDLTDLNADKKPKIYLRGTDDANIFKLLSENDIPDNLVIDGKANGSGLDYVNLEFLTDFAGVKATKISETDEEYMIELPNGKKFKTKNVERLRADEKRTSLESHAGNVVPSDGRVIAVNDLKLFNTIFGRLNEGNDNLHLSGVTFDQLKVDKVQNEPGNYTVKVGDKTYKFVGVEKVTIGSLTKTLEALATTVIVDHDSD